MSIYEHELTSLRAKLDRSNTELEEAREQLRAALSSVVSDVGSVGSPLARDSSRCSSLQAPECLDLQIPPVSVSLLIPCCTLAG